jgi:anaphase-promoting complex subunit 6
MPGQHHSHPQHTIEPDQLRCLVQDCIAKHLYSTAVFFADKLVTLTGHAPGDVYLLAQVG